MKTTTTKTYQNANSAEKAATAKTKKTGIEHLALEVDGRWMVLTTEEFDLLGSTESELESVELESAPETVSEPEPQELSIHVNGSFEQIDTDPEEASTESEALLEEIVGLLETASEPETVDTVETTESAETETESAETTETTETTDPEPEMVAKPELAPFGMKPGYTKELTIPYFGYQGLKYLKTADPQGNRIRLAASRVHVVKVDGEWATIKTTPTYAAHRNFA